LGKLLQYTYFKKKIRRSETAVLKLDEAGKAVLSTTGLGKTEKQPDRFPGVRVQISLWCDRIADLRGRPARVSGWSGVS
jgi:hypothetical protein